MRKHLPSTREHALTDRCLHLQWCGYDETRKSRARSCLRFSKEVSKDETAKQGPKPSGTGSIISLLAGNAKACADAPLATSPCYYVRVSGGRSRKASSVSMNISSPCINTHVTASAYGPTFSSKSVPKAFSAKPAITTTETLLLT